MFWAGEPNIQDLELMVLGYELALKDAGLEQTRFSQKFCEFLMARYGVSGARGWVAALSEIASQRDTTAISPLRELLDEFEPV